MADLPHQCEDQENKSSNASLLYNTKAFYWTGATAKCILGEKVLAGIIKPSSIKMTCATLQIQEGSGIKQTNTGLQIQAQKLWVRATYQRSHHVRTEPTLFICSFCHIFICHLSADQGILLQVYLENPLVQKDCRLVKQHELSPLPLRIAVS